MHSALKRYGLSLIFIGIPCLIHCWFVLSNIVNFPFQDDTLLLEFVNAVSKENVSINVFFEQLFKVDNDHILVIPRLVCFTDFLIHGHLDFRLYIFIANINLFAIFFFLWFQFRQTKLPFYYFFPIPFLFFQPQMWEISLWALNGMQHSFILLFVSAIIYCIETKKTWAFITALVLGLFATFSHGNGILIYPVIFLALMVQSRYREGFIWILGMISSLVLYLSRYEVSQSASLSTNILRILESFFAIFGFNASVFLPMNEIIVTSLGVILFFFMFFVIETDLIRGIIKKAKTTQLENLGLITLFCFIVLTAAIISFVRSWNGVVMESRFAIYASLSTIIVYIMLAVKLDEKYRKIWFLAILPLSVIFNYCSYINEFKVVDYRKSSLQADIFNWKYNHTMLSVPGQFTKNADFFLSPVYQKKIWILPDYWDENAGIIENSEPQNAGNYKLNVHLNRQKIAEKTGFSIRSEAEIINLDFPFVKGNTNEAVYLALKHNSDKTLLLIPTFSNTNSRIRTLWEQKYFKQGFRANFNTDHLHEGTYQIGFVTLHNNIASIHFSRDVFNIKGQKISFVADGRILSEI